MLDSAVVTFGRIIENAAEQMVNVGGDDKPQWERKYSLTELLTPGFTLQPDGDDSIEQLRGMEGVLFDEV